MIRIIIVILFFLPATGFSQLYINKTKKQVKKELGKISVKETGITATITETDSTVLLKIRGANTIEADHIYSFDKSRKCSAEKTITWCDSCHEKLIQPLLTDTKYKWKKINMNQYISELDPGIFVEVQHIDNTWSFTIFRATLSKEIYKLILENQ